MATTVIQDILNNGKSINDKLQEKISLLNQRNSAFNGTLTKKLNDIISAIGQFKSTNLQGLTETKNKLTSVTDELTATKQQLGQTQSELEQVKNSLATSQSELQTTTTLKTELEQKVTDLNDKIRTLDLEYQNKMNGMNDTMTQKNNEEKNAIKQEYDAKITELNNEKTELQKSIQDAQQSQNGAIEKLSLLQKEQEGLVNNLGSINALLANQLELISSINTDQPNDEEYSKLLETIQNGLGGVISEINQAVSSSQQASNTPLYDKYMTLTQPQKDEILYSLAPEYSQKIVSSPADKKNINSILFQRYRGNLLLGGKRRKYKKTMKKDTKKQKRHQKTKRHRKTKKNLKGGYIYSSSKKLDNSSSVISAPSRIKSRTVSSYNSLTPYSPKSNTRRKK